MPWFKIDDGFWSHPKILELSDAAVALWVRAGSYCAGHLTDGVVKRSTLRMLGADRDAATELVLAGLWDTNSDGVWSFHDWEDYQPTREEVLKDRAAAAERKRVSRERSRAKSQKESQRDSRVTDGVSPASPTRPDPTRPLSTSNEVERALTPYCRKHPGGTDEPCGACGTARLAFTAAEKREKTKPTPAVRKPPTCPVHAEYPADCPRCAEEAA